MRPRKFCWVEVALAAVVAKLKVPLLVLGSGSKARKATRLLAEGGLGNDVADDADIQRILQDDGRASARVHQTAEVAVAHGSGRHDAEGTGGAGARHSPIPS